ncbi:hypothetical protein [Streptomyces noursei]|uniref:hypothetical protein n=1 Tax=Streptomyces noursei TaxID=1971 RepID=UPI0023B878EF|nr:hypothetical protein [Streptomyces noursei]
MELHVILDEWCEVAEETNAVVRRTLDGDRPNVVHPSRFNPIGRVAFPKGLVYQAGRAQHLLFVDAMRRDAGGILQNQAPWWQRWRGSRRRQGARRSLRNMMKLYCPELLDSFESAVDGRAQWILENRKNLPVTLSSPDTPTEVVEGLARELETTLAALRDARRQLGDLIRQAYPLGPLPDEA